VAEAATSLLAGKRVVITRAASQSSELFERLTKRGAIPISLPLVSFSPPEDFAALDAALLEWQQFDWVLFASANAVRAVISRSGDLGRNLHPSGKRPHIAVVGPATREEAERAGLSVDYLAKTHLGVALAEELGERLRAQRVFLPRSDRANPDLPAVLQRLGAKVSEVIAYRTLPPSDTDREHVRRTVRGQADAVLFFSPTAVQNFVGLAGCEQLGVLQSTVALVAIGPITAGALRESGVQRMVMAADTTAAKVVDALEEHFAAAKKHSTAGAQHP
jgi:uroporphyrinogen III methyltransferase / synthase